MVTWDVKKARYPERKGQWYKTTRDLWATFAIPGDKTNTSERSGHNAREYALRVWEHLTKIGHRKDGYPTRPLRDGIRPSRDLNQMLKAQQVNIGITETERKILSPNKVTERLQTYQSRAGMMHWKARQLNWENHAHRIGRPNLVIERDGRQTSREQVWLQRGSTTKVGQPENQGKILPSSLAARDGYRNSRDLQRQHWKARQSN